MQGAVGITPFKTIAAEVLRDFVAGKIDAKEEAVTTVTARSASTSILSQAIREL